VEDFDEIMDALPQRLQNEIMAKMRGEEATGEDDLDLPDLGFELWPGVQYRFRIGH